MDSRKFSRINVRVTDDLRDRLERLAAKEHMSLGEVVRMLLREGVSANRAPDRKQLSLLSDASRQLTGIAINMNQVARLSNMRPDEPLEAEALADLSAIAKDVSKVLDVLRSDLRRIVDWRERARGSADSRPFSIADYVAAQRAGRSGDEEG